VAEDLGCRVQIIDELENRELFFLIQVTVKVGDISRMHLLDDPLSIGISPSPQQLPDALQ
jgi:hypothetical protein